MEQSILVIGTIKGVGNVTNIQTWNDPFRSLGIFYGFGKGVITTIDGQMATWIGYDIGRLINDGTIVYHGVYIFRY